MKKLFEKIRAAWRARRDKRKLSTCKTPTLGVEVKRCSECDLRDCRFCGWKDFAESVAKLPSCNNCRDRKTCAFRTEWGEYARINCILWTKEEAET